MAGRKMHLPKLSTDTKPSTQKEEPSAFLATSSVPTPSQIEAFAFSKTQQSEEAQIAVADSVINNTTREESTN